MTLVERLEAAVTRLEAIRDADPQWKFGYQMMELLPNGLVKYHFTHPSFGTPFYHYSEDQCEVLTLANAKRRYESTKDIVYG